MGRRFGIRFERGERSEQADNSYLTAKSSDRRCGCNGSRGTSPSGAARQPETAGAPAPQKQFKGGIEMNGITTKDGVSIFYKDWGTGPTVAFSHGWPLSADAW